MDTVETLLASRKTEDRIRAVMRLARHPSDDNLPLLLRGLADKNHYVAAISAEALQDCADLGALSIMIDRFLDVSRNGPKLDPGCHIRANLAFAFGKQSAIHAEGALRVGIRTVQMEPVGGVLYDTGAHLRANCALALAQIQSQAALRDITLLLFDHGLTSLGSGDVLNRYIEPRKAAARALGILSTPEARTPLTLRLKYPVGDSPDVLQECMQALVRLEDPDLLETLKPFTDSEDPNEADLAVYAALMLAEARTEGVEQVLHAQITRFRGGAMRAAILALSSLRTPQAEAILQTLKSDGRRDIQEAIQNL